MYIIPHTVIIIVPVVYMALGVMILMWAIHFEGPFGSAGP
jgi:hypothetical protein